MAPDAEPDELTQIIARHLEVDWRYVQRVDARDIERIAEIRAAGRRAGRLLGYKIVTRQSEPSPDQRVAVSVVVREPPSEEDRLRLQERSRLLRNEAYSDLMPPEEIE